MSHREKEFCLTLIRHGQTSANLLRHVQGHSDTPLTDLGLKQAYSLANYLKSNTSWHEFDRIYSSDLARALETSKIIKSICCSQGKEIVTDVRLRERKYGHLYEGRPIENLRLDALRAGSDLAQYTPHGAESRDEVRARVVDFFYNVVAAESSDGDEILIVSHWATIKEFLKLFQSKCNEIKEEHIRETPNTAYSRFRIRCRNVADPQGKNNDEQREQLTVNVNVISLHQTLHLNMESTSAKLTDK